MAKPIAFISHITEEGEVARHLKELIERRFLRSVEVFASSHEESIRLGDEWLAAIKTSLTRCGLMVVICSPVSIARPWINFEAGAGWVRGIPVVPMCHSGQTPGKLPVPLNALQGGLVGNRADIQKLFGRLAALADIDAPVVDDQEFFERIHNFETDARENLLVQDSQFIATLLHRHVELLEFGIYASTGNYDYLKTIDFSTSRLENYNFTFHDVDNLFNLFVFNPFINTKVYQAIQAIVLRIADNIRFILSNNHLRIAPELEELFKDFLYALEFVDKWADMIALIDRAAGGDTSTRDFVIEMIKEEPLPPEHRRTSNLINAAIDYYEGLVFYKKWIITYKDSIARLTGAELTRA